MKARQTISRGGFSPEDVALLDGVFLAAWRQVEGRYPLEDADRNVASEQLASIVVMLGQSWENLEPDSLQKVAVEIFNKRT